MIVFFTVICLRFTWIDLSAREALISLGVAAERVTAQGMGEDFSVASNNTEEGRVRNRRVDVILLDD